VGGASIYILLCSDGSHYAGVTRRSVEERVSEHDHGLMSGYTFTRRPVKLVFSEHYERIVDAIAAESRIKGRSRAKKEAYMCGDFSAGGAREERFEAGRVSRKSNRRSAMDRPSRLCSKSASGRGACSASATRQQSAQPQRRSFRPKASSME
jgi:putative endonuclease